MARSPIVALIMGVIPVVNLYLIYSWWNELKAAGKSDKNPILWTLLLFIPLVNLYVLYSLMGTVDDAAKKAKKDGYPFGVIPLIIVSIILLGLPFLFVIYKTQDLMNECGI